MILTVDLSLERLGVLKEVLCINAVMKNNLKKYYHSKVELLAKSLFLKRDSQ